jgi:lipopolysaccharide/colanic/teichoic acid biosynthesis glycosyltransferase
VKRAFDVLMSAAALLLLSPLLLGIALAVRLDSPGPALFRQQRIGRNERPFEILKFRTMRGAAPGHAGHEITVAGDARITRVGALLRRSKLDELPQLLNVLRGQMSLVGPRPEVPRYVRLYPDDARAEVLSVRPGITDEAAIEFRDEGELLARAADPERAYVEEILPRKIQLYRRYVRGRTFAGDLGILLRTGAALFRRDGGR